MATSQPTAPAASLAPATQVGIVGLTVADRARSLDFYTRALGFAVIAEAGATTVLGVGRTPLLVLTERPGARPWLVDEMTGLYHFAILLPTRPDLGRWLTHFLSLNYPPPGQGDHIVSEAFYLRDPDGHGIEVYWDRPRATWSWQNGRVRMGTGPIDIRGLLNEAAQAGGVWSALPAGTTIGHIHLQVGDIKPAADFYHRLIGFDIVAQLPQALFVSAGGYHHHLGLNTWHSRGAGPASADTASMRFFSLALPDAAARSAVVDRLRAGGVTVTAADMAMVVRDPWQNLVLLHVGAVADAVAATALDAAAGG